MTTFEDLFRLVAENDGELRLSYAEPSAEERRHFGGDVKKLRLEAHLGFSPRGRRRDSACTEIVVSTRDMRMARSRGVIEVAHMRERVAAVAAKLREQLASPAEMLERLADDR